MYVFSQDPGWEGFKSLKNKEDKQWAKMEKIGMNHCRSFLPEEIWMSKSSPCQKAGTTDVGGGRKLKKNKSQM